MNHKEAEIDLNDLVHYLLLKWRSVLICMIVGIIVMGGYGYCKSVPIVSEESKGTLEPSDEASLRSLGSELSDYEKREVALSVKTYLEYEKNYNDRASLANRSIVMQYDAFHVPYYTIYYKISNYSDENVPSESTVTNVDNIIALYKNALNDVSVVEEIKKQNNWNYESAFIRELYGVSKVGLDMMNLLIHAPTREDCDNICRIVTKTIDNVSSDIQNQYEHNILMIQSVPYEMYASAFLDKQKELNDSLIGIEKGMQQISSAMTAEQKAYYAALLKAVKQESEETGDVIDSLEIINRISQENFAVDSSNLTASQSASLVENPEHDENNTTSFSQRTISAKYVFVGLVTGLFLSVFINGAIYAKSSKLRTCADIQDVFGISIIGAISIYDKYQRPFGGVDKLIDSLFKDKSDNISLAEKMDMIASFTCLEVQKAELKSLFVTESGNGRSAEELMGELAKQVENNTFCDGSFAFATGDSPLKNVDSLKKLSASDSVILVEEKWVSRYGDISRVVEMCGKLGIRILGAVVLS